MSKDMIEKYRGEIKENEILICKRLEVNSIYNFTCNGKKFLLFTNGFNNKYGFPFAYGYTISSKTKIFDHIYIINSNGYYSHVKYFVKDRKLNLQEVANKSFDKDFHISRLYKYFNGLETNKELQLFLKGEL